MKADAGRSGRAAARRVHARTRNLVVAATGTGKTVIAALDYRRLRAQGMDTLLFVAHRDRILAQSQETFATVLGSPSFGERYVGGDRPVVGRHVFASIQSLTSAMAKGLPSAHAFDVVIVDEVHHAAADTYARLLRHLRPKVLLGLTATPERSDDTPGGRLALDEFFDRPWASELRVWQAIDRQILVPFNYFAIDDGTDLRALRWVPGAFTGSRRRAPRGRHPPAGGTWTRRSCRSCSCARPTRTSGAWAWGTGSWAPSRARMRWASAR